MVVAFLKESIWGMIKEHRFQFKMALSIAFQ
jgi:hypothetical protein